MVDNDKVIVHNNSIFQRRRNIPEVPDFQELAIKNRYALFGEDSVVIYLDARKKLESIAGVGRIPDGLLLTVGSSSDLELWVIEYEIEGHDLRKHVIPQLVEFAVALQNQKTMDRLWDILLENIERDPDASERLKAAIGSRHPIRFYQSARSRRPGIAIVIDKVPSKEMLIEVMKRISIETGINPVVLEFTPFQNKTTGEQMFLVDRLESQNGQIVTTGIKETEIKATRRVGSDKKLSHVVRDIVRGYNYKIFDIAEVNDSAGRIYPELLSEVGSKTFYHRVRAEIFHLKSNGKLKKIGEKKGHSGKYQQIAEL